MSHLALARKWRPKKFTDLVGQQQTRTILKNILTSKRLHHAYLLTGTRGVGKTTIARIIAKALNCLNLIDSEPCGQCTNCLAIDIGRFIDVIEIDAASNTGVDNVRELIDDAKYAPSAGSYKIYIIDEVHMLSKSAFNAMLKTLEEPPEHAIFILATTDPQKVPITILSRCLQLKLRNLLTAEIDEHLKYILKLEDIAYEDDALHIIAKAANGSMRDALSLLDQAIAFSPNKINVAETRDMLGISDNELSFNILDAILQSNTTELIQIAKSASDKGDSFENILENLREQLCNISIAQLSAIASDKKLIQYSKSFSINDIQLYFEIANLGLEQLNKSSDKYSTIIMILLRMVAFRIGNSNERQIVLTNSNFKASTNETIQKEAIKSNQPTVIKQQNENDTSNLITKNIEPVSALKSDSPTGDLSTQSITELTKPDIPITIEPIPSIAKSIIQSTNVPNNIKKNEVVIQEIKSPAVSDHKEKPTETSDDLQPFDNEVTLTSYKSETLQEQTSKNNLFNGDWFHLITELKKDLGYLYPVLENSSLSNEKNLTFEIMVDKRYEDIISPDAKIKITETFNNYFKSTTTLLFKFTDNLNGTLKEKFNHDEIVKQGLAEDSIKNDPNLNRILETFSATIIPGSIKSI
jgi:DNA polymerase III subunit gamma/tau